MFPVRFNPELTEIKNSSSIAERASGVASGGRFRETLDAETKKLGDLKISAHAQKRLSERQVTFGAAEQARLESAVDKLQKKGADKSIVLMDDLVFLVSARNRVVITAVDSGSAKDGIFTNIDSAVIT